MELVPPNKEIDWFCHKSSKYGAGPTQEKKMTGSAQHIEACNKLIYLNKNILKTPLGSSNVRNILFPLNNLLGGTSFILRTFTVEPVIFIGSESDHWLCLSLTN